MLKLYIFFLQNNIFSYICYMNKNLLFIVPHLSTGGAPQFTLNKIELLRNEYNILCIEYNCISSHFVVQRNKIIEILKNDFISLSDNKSELLVIYITNYGRIIKSNTIKISIETHNTNMLHINEHRLIDLEYNYNIHINMNV